MSFTIIRNIKHKSNTLNLAFRHNERRNTNYSNKDIDKSKGKKNYSIKACNVPYSKHVLLLLLQPHKLPAINHPKFHQLPNGP